MSLPAVANPLPQFVGLDGRPLSAGTVYIGVANEDPETHPQAVYWDAAATQAAAQPLGTLAGYIYNLGSPATPYTTAPYSIRVKNIQGEVVFEEAAALSDIATLFADFASLAADDGYKLIGGAVTYVSTRTALATYGRVPGRVIWLDEGLRVGFFRWLVGDYSAQVTADPLQGFYVPPSTDTTGASGAWGRIWDGTNGRPEWFGAIVNDPTANNVVALEACFALCQTTQMSAADYYIKSRVTFELTNRVWEGAGYGGTDLGIGIGLPMGQPGGTRVILNGALVASSDVVLFGKTSGPTDNADITRHSVIRDMMFARDCSVYKVNPGTSTDPATCVSGVTMTFVSDCLLDRVKSADSPIGFRINGCITSMVRECNASRATVASSSTYDYMVGYLVGGYAINFGYVGSNASIYFDHCTVFDKPSGITKAWGLRLFGAIADTFCEKFEMARLDVGVEVDGRDASGTTMTNGGAHQDVKFSNLVADGVDGPALWIHNLNDYGSIMVNDPYLAGVSGYGMVVENAGGTVGVSLGYMIQGGHEGLRVTNVNSFTIRGTQIRDATIPVQLENVKYSTIEPVIFQKGAAANQGINMVNCARNSVAPNITEAPGLLNAGIIMDTDCGFNDINPTKIQFDGMATPAAAWKVRFNDADASTGTGATAFAAAGNVMMGVTT